jgi:hypothetical protein
MYCENGERGFESNAMQSFALALGGGTMRTRRHLHYSFSAFSIGAALNTSPHRSQDLSMRLS